jgi:hypothetical protein
VEEVEEVERSRGDGVTKLNYDPKVAGPEGSFKPQMDADERRWGNRKCGKATLGKGKARRKGTKG